MPQLAAFFFFSTVVVTELENVVSVSVESQKVYPGTGHMVSWYTLLRDGSSH